MKNGIEPDIRLPVPNGTWLLSTFKRFLTAFSMTVIIVGGFTICIGMLLWAIAELLHLPKWFALALDAATAIICVSLAGRIFIRSLRMEETYDKPDSDNT